MSLSAIGPVPSVANSSVVQMVNSAPAPTQSSAPSPQADTVTISPAGQKAAQGGDVDRDGDSH